MVVKLDQKTAFDGEGTLTLHGLPNRCQTQPVKINREAKEAVFRVKTEARTPLGQHKSLFCQLVVPQAGENLVQNLAGGGVLRIDKPRPKAVAVKAAPKPAAPQAKPAAAPKPRRLSRLEQLRLEAAERAKKTK